MSNHRASFKLPCNCHVIHAFETVDNENDNQVIGKGDTVIAVTFDAVNNSYRCKHNNQFYDIPSEMITPCKRIDGVVFVATVKTAHGDIYDEYEDGTATLGVFSNLEDAEDRILTTYENDRNELLQYSCADHGPCELTNETPLYRIPSENPLECHEKASLEVFQKDPFSLDRLFEYEIRSYIVE